MACDGKADASETVRGCLAGPEQGPSGSPQNAVALP
jgi:hypothetical protein